MNLLETKSYAVRYHRRSKPVFGPADIIVPSVRTLGFLGPNGSGKSTFLRSFVEETFFRSGEAKLLAGSPSHLVEGGHVAYVAQIPDFAPYASVFHSVALGLWRKTHPWKGLSAEQQKNVEATLENFGLSQLSDRSLDQISHGERQRVFLARAVLQRPRLLILDEPTNHLDPIMSRRFWKLLLSNQSTEGMSVLVATHDLAFAKDHCDWICGIETGRLSASLPKAEFWNSAFARKMLG